MNWRFSGSYFLALPNVRSDAGPYSQAIEHLSPWLASLSSCDGGLELTVAFDTEDREGASALADRHATELAEHMSLCLAAILTRPVEAKPVDWRLESADKNEAESVAYVPPAKALFTGHAPTAVVTRRLEGARLENLLRDFRLRQMAPAPTFANDLVIARQMLIAALSVDNLVAKFLILYSALSVFGLFKFGPNGAKHDYIDRILLMHDPGLSVAKPQTRSGSRTRPETTFTQARNGFIHAEDRGRDPKAAIESIEKCAPQFLEVVAEILKKG